MDSRTISLIGCGASGAYVPGPDEEENGLTMTFFHITDNSLYINYFSLEPLIKKLFKNHSVTNPYAVEHTQKIKIIV